MRRKGPLLGAILLSVLGHGVLLLVSLERDVEPPQAVPVLELVLERAPAEPVEVPPGVVDRVSDRRSAEVAEPAVEPERPPEIPRTVLNLKRPENWDELVESISDPGVKLDFNVDLKNRVAIRESDKRRKQLVEGRVAAVYGLRDELYARVSSLGTEVKIDGKCYVLVESLAIEEGTRWWRGKCKETTVDPFLLDPIEYDAIGRVIAD